MKIGEIYRMICHLYGLDASLDIERFLVASPTPAEYIIGNRLPEREALFIRDAPDGLELGLFIAPQILARLDSADPLDELDAFACAVEGVSHFAYVCDRAEREQRLSVLELELQGEIDKFLLIHLIAAERGGSTHALFARQFESHAFDPQLSVDERECYQTASHFAAKFCAHLRERYFNPLRRDELIASARDFFARGLSEKIERLVP